MGLRLCFVVIGCLVWCLVAWFGVGGLLALLVLALLICGIGFGLDFGFCCVWVLC